MINTCYLYCASMHFKVGHWLGGFLPPVWNNGAPLLGAPYNHHLVGWAQCHGAVLQCECDSWCHIQVTCWHHHDNGDLGSKCRQMSLGYLVTSQNNMSHPGCDWRHHENGDFGSAAQMLSTGSVAPHRPDHTMFYAWVVKLQYLLTLVLYSTN